MVEVADDLLARGHLGQELVLRDLPANLFLFIQHTSNPHLTTRADTLHRLQAAQMPRSEMVKWRMSHLPALTVALADVLNLLLMRRLKLLQPPLPNPAQ